MHVGSYVSDNSVLRAEVHVYVHVHVHVVVVVEHHNGFKI